MRYHFGFYPTTRTFFDLNIIGGKNIFNQNYRAVILADLYYYFSPRLRGFIKGNFNYNFDVNYYFNNGYYFNDFMYATSADSKRFSISIGLNYAIF